MIKTTFKLAVIFLLTAINSCYYERETDQLKVCYIRSGSIWVMNIDGSDQRQITNSGDDNMPSWSPDGKRILFERGSTIANIYIINSDGENLKQLSTIKSSSATWSADGENIFYYEENGSDYSIITAKPDGTIIRKYPITDQANALSASPDGKYIYYLKSSTSYQLDLTTGDEDNHTTSILDHGSLSPDGNLIAYDNGTGVWLYHLNTGSSRNIVPSGTQPCWTPDGKTILYAYYLDIYSINIDGTYNRNLTKSGFSHSPCVKWKPK